MTVIYGALFGVLAAILLCVGITLYCGVQEIGWRNPRELIRGLKPVLVDQRLKQPMGSLVLWFASYGTVFGMVLSAGAMKFAGVFTILCYIGITMLYRYVVARKQGVGYQPRAHWKQFWAVRKHIDELHKADQKAYTTFYASSILLGLFWYWIGIFDPLVK